LPWDRGRVGLDLAIPEAAAFLPAGPFGAGARWRGARSTWSTSSRSWSTGRRAEQQRDRAVAGRGGVPL